VGNISVQKALFSNSVYALLDSSLLFIFNLKNGRADICCLLISGFVVYSSALWDVYGICGGGGQLIGGDDEKT
jgi:hypothetical protein